MSNCFCRKQLPVRVMADGAGYLAGGRDGPCGVLCSPPCALSATEFLLPGVSFPTGDTLCQKQMRTII